MGRSVDIGLVMDAQRIAERAGVKSPQAVHNWRARYADFPEPIAVFGKAVLWYWPDVEIWLRATGRTS
jgi:hypothetical protein